MDQQAKGWYVVNVVMNRTVRGPYKWRETAEAVCEELERSTGHGLGYSIERRGKQPKPRKKFQRPTVADVLAYCVERNNGLDPQAFVDFYTSKGWRVGRTPMKDWKAAVRTWEQRRIADANGNGKAEADERQAKRDFEDFIHGRSR